jgi:2-dehydropantoate 2-reductase
MAGQSERKTVAIIGLGSIGGIIAGLLCTAGRHDVVACVRRPIDHLTVERPEGVVEVPLHALTDPDQARPADWVLLCTKAQDTPSSAPWLRRLCGPHTRVAVLQNGIGHAERLAPLVGDATVVPTIVYYNGERLSADRVRFRRAGDHELTVADDVEGRAFEALLDGTNLRVLRSADFTTRAWRKLLINAVANPVTALTLQRQAVFRREDVKALCRAILEEAAAVGRADGAQLAPDEAEQMLATLLTYPADAGTSMYFDRLAGRPLEGDALTGAIVAAGARRGLPTPFNSLLLTLLRATSDGLRDALRKEMNEQPRPKKPAFDPAEVRESNFTSYPEKHRAANQTRFNRRLGDHAGLKNFGVNITRIIPGGQSSFRHAHSHQDEFIYVLDGEVVLETNAGAQVLSAGTCAGFPAGSGDAHRFVNRTDGDAKLLVIGDRTADDEISYPDVDMHARLGPDGAYRFTTKAGEPL